MAQDIASIILKYLKSKVEESLGLIVNSLKIVVPDSANKEERLATKEACKLAGFE